MVAVDSVTLKSLDDGQHLFQESLLNGNMFDRAGYEQLAATYQQCLNDAGADLSEGSMQTAYGTYHFEISYANDSAAGVAACTREFWEPLGPLWSRFHVASRDQIQEGNDALGRCLRAAGEDFPHEHPTLEDFHRFNEEGGRYGASFFECTRTVGRELKLPNFAGG